MTNEFQPISAEQETVAIYIEEDERTDTPACRIALRSENDKTGLKFISNGTVKILNRHRKGMKEFKMEDIAASIHYNEDKQITMIELHEFIDDPAHQHRELENFITLTKDKKAAKAYRMLAWYWTSITFGYIFTNGLEVGTIDPTSIGLITPSDLEGPDSFEDPFP